MKKKFLIYLSIIFLSGNYFFTEVNSKINNIIVVKVGNSVITSTSIQNEILTSLILENKKITQENINNRKQYALKKLINNLIRKNEVDKYKITDYNKLDLERYIEKVGKNFGTNTDGLKAIFKQNKLSYDFFIEQYKTELRWNSLIYLIYKNQININTVEVENDVNEMIDDEIIEFNLSEIVLSKAEHDQENLNRIIESIKNEDFGTIAKKFSIASTASNDGQLGWISSESLSKQYLQKIMNLSIGDISAPISDENSISFLKVNDAKTTTNALNKEGLKEKILLQKKEEKLKLFSRSHFSNLENTVQVSFL
ncbi:peptidylprolyl isomerase [Pelagibacteraceae bacterium]|nr:peptidylprolyl isomerase [Pelagibacteraceae bacterium]